MTNVTLPGIPGPNDAWGATLNADLTALAADLTTLQGIVASAAFLSQNAQLIAWTLDQQWAWTNPTYDSDHFVTVAAVTWPDGTTGTYNGIAKDGTNLAMCNKFTVTYVVGAVTKTVTQNTISRDGSGYPTSQPLPTVA